jgi:hypothetical protein
MHIRNTILVLSVLTFFIQVRSQSTSSPYSIFAEGLIESSGTGTNHALGGSGIALHSKYSLNSLNPASYTGIDSNSFIFEAGVFGKYTRYNTSSETQRRYDANLRYLAMGCRVTKWWQTSFGFMPYSTVGYSINAFDYVEGEMTSYYKKYEGNGGINQFYWSHSLRLIKNLSLGLNISYYLGSIEKTESGTTGDGVISYVISKKSNVHSVMLDYGAQYTFNHKDYSFTLGAVYSGKSDMSTTNELNIEFSDGIIELEAEDNNYTIPVRYGVGLALEKGDNLRISLDYEKKEWGKIKEFKNPLLKTRDAERFSAGLEYTPYKGFREEGWKNLSYRVGGNYNKSYLIINQVPLNSFSIVMGLGVPLKHELSMINFSIEAGSLGSSKNGLFSEDYLLMHLNFTLHDKWFMKYRIN